MTDLASWREEMRDRIHQGLVENSARFHPKVIVYEGHGRMGRHLQPPCGRAATAGVARRGL